VKTRPFGREAGIVASGSALCKQFSREKGVRLKR